MRFLHVADIHLDSPMRHLRRMDDEAQRALAHCTRRALKNLVDFALKPANGIEFVIIAGDVFDGTWKDYQTGLFLQEEMLRLRNAAIPVVAIRGNHDAQSKMIRDLSDWRDSIAFLDSDSCQSLRGSEIGLSDDVIIHGQSFRDASVTDNLAACYPVGSRGAFHLGLLHTSLTGFAGHDNYAPCSVDDLRSRGYGYWALGHIHARQAMHRDGDDTPIHFAGNLQGRHIRECGAKGAIVVDVDGDFRATTRFVAFDVLRWDHLFVELEAEDDFDAARTRLERSLERAMQERQGRELAIRVTFRGRCKAHSTLMSGRFDLRAEVQSVVADIGKGVVWLEEVEADTRPPYDRDRMAQGDGPAAELIRFLDELAGHPQRLSESEDVSALLTRLRPALRSETGLPAEEKLLSPEHLRRLLPKVEALLLDAMQDPASER